MKTSIHLPSIGLGLLLAGCIVASLAMQSTSFQTALPRLTLEQAEILSHMSIVHLPDGQAGMCKAIRISGVNVQVVNGLGSTATKNGLGNVIVGYLEAGLPLGDDRTGSHNIVGGTLNSYSSWGGLVAGRGNTVGAPWASVSGGAANLAGAPDSSVGGGYLNHVTGNYGWAAGGGQNVVYGEYGSACGGSLNSVGGINALVSGGVQNLSDGDASTISGGESNRSSGTRSSVSGGFQRIANGIHNWVGGSPFEQF